MAFDQARQRTVLFGGSYYSNFNTTLLGDTWRWDGQAWEAIAGTSPSARMQHAMAYDAARQRVVLFGGLTAVGPTTVSSQTWTWDGATWTQIGNVASPLARAGHAMAYDSARQRVVMFGGVDAQGVEFADTWEWDGINWIPRVSSALPPARVGHAMAYDSVRQVVVLFGGKGANGLTRNDTWKWNGTDWSAGQPATSPAAREAHAMTFDAARQRILMLAGRASSASGSLFGDCWEWDGSNWSQMLNANLQTPRWGTGMVFDAALQCVAFFGGAREVQGTPSYLADTWVLGGTPATALPYGTGCGAPPLSFLSPNDGRPVLGAYAAAVVANPPSPLMVVAAGVSRTVTGPFQLPLPLGGFGMTGCFMHQSGEVLGMGTLAEQGGGQRFATSIPNASNLIGYRLYLQAYGYAPAANPLEVVVSNGLEWRIGTL